MDGNDTNPSGPVVAIAFAPESLALWYFYVESQTWGMIRWAVKNDHTGAPTLARHKSELICRLGHFGQPGLDSSCRPVPPFHTKHYFFVPIYLWMILYHLDRLRSDEFLTALWSIYTGIESNQMS